MAYCFHQEYSNPHRNYCKGFNFSRFS